MNNFRHELFTFVTDMRFSTLRRNHPRTTQDTSRAADKVTSEMTKIYTRSGRIRQRRSTEMIHQTRRAMNIQHDSTQAATATAAAGGSGGGGAAGGGGGEQAGARF